MPIAAGPDGYTSTVIPSPAGWRWGSLPTYYSDSEISPGHLRADTNTRASMDAYRQAIQTLVDWANEHDIHVIFYDSRTIADGQQVYADFMVYPDLPRKTQRDDYTGMDITIPQNCAGCSTVIQPGSETCPGCGHEVVCSACRRHFWGRTMLATENGTITCSRCSRPCNYFAPEIGASCGRAITARFSFCESHAVNDRHTCAGCNQDFDNSALRLVRIAGQEYDAPCARGRCMTCGTAGPHRRLDHQERHICDSCHTRMQRFFVLSTENRVVMPAEDFVILSLPERPVRLVSVELEFCVGARQAMERPGHLLAQRLYAERLTPWNQQMRYHCGMHEYPAHVENDSSVDGGELILNRLRFDQTEDASHFRRIMELTDTMVGEQALQFNARCGTHTHVDMHGYGILDARNLVTMYNYLEDVIYRFAAAGYRDHRALINGSDYARPLLKGEWPTAREFGVAYLRQANHRDSLNMEHFFKAWSSCHCGAIQFGDASECTCIRPKNTAEWRVFNGTNDPRTLWAWIVFVQSLTAWCQDREIDPAAYEPLGFEAGISFMDDRLGDAHNNLVEAWRHRLDWVFNNLVFTDRERNVILDVMSTTPLQHIGEREIARLRDVRNRDEGRTLTVPYIAARRAATDFETEQAEWMSRIDEDGVCGRCDQDEEYCECSPPMPPLDSRPYPGRTPTSTGSRRRRQ